MIDHDQLFKELLTTFFAEFLELFLPELRRDLDAKSVTFLDKEVFSDLTAGATHRADLVVKARFRGQESFFIIHVERQAQPQVHFPRRMFTYFAALHARHAVPVYPIALFSHDSPQPEPDKYLVHFPDLEVLTFRYRTIQLSRLNWRDFVQQSNPVASALMARMEIAPGERSRVKLECLRLLVTLHLDVARMRLISGFIDTYLNLNKEETLHFQKGADMLLKETEKDAVMELTTSWKEEGREEGRAEGKIEGREEARQHQAALIVRLLRKRFGPLEADWEAQVGQYSFDQLGALEEALLDFQSLSDLRDWLFANGQSTTTS